MIRFNPKTGRWSDEQSSRLCSFMSSMMLGGSAAAPPVITLDGTAQDNAASATQVYTVVGTIPALSYIFIAGAIVSSTRNLSSVTDSKGNTYTLEAGVTTGTSEDITTASSRNATQLIGGDTITLTWSGVATGHACAVAWSNRSQASAPDVSRNNSGTGTAVSSLATGVTTQASEVAIGVVAAGTAVVVTEDAAYTNLCSITYAGAARRFNVAYRILTVTAAQTYAPTLATSQNWAALVQTYKVP